MTAKFLTFVITSHRLVVVLNGLGEDAWTDSGAHPSVAMLVPYQSDWLCPYTVVPIQVFREWQYLPSWSQSSACLK